MVISWKKVESAKGYRIILATNKKFKKNKKNIIVKSNKNKYTIKKLKAKKLYYVKIQAYKLNSGKKVYGKFSDIKKKKTK